MCEKLDVWLLRMSFAGSGVTDLGLGTVATILGSTRLFHHCDAANAALPELGYRAYSV